MSSRGAILLRQGYGWTGKAVVVNGGERGGEYFRIVADYIHLNPVRAGLVGGTSRRALVRYADSSLPHYAGGSPPAWLVTERVLEAFRLRSARSGRKAYVAYLEERSRSRVAALNDPALEELRKGWCLGEKNFKDRVLDSITEVLAQGREKQSIAGGAVRAHDERAAGKEASAALKALGVPCEEGELAVRGLYLKEKALVATLLRKRHVAANGWIAKRLGMGHSSNVSNALRKVREDRSLMRRLRKLERQKNE